MKAKDRDEWPMAMFEEGGKGASVRHIDPSDNRGAGSSIGNILSDLPNGTKIKVEVY
ncbi:NucA/NucB deoxyribonuclease domain-containing protein [Pseudomonas entomophila]|uniref:NucA/NucB deoxyribonuclease domain-containing protein n=1 Tax=Pseudomonas entomophila TaxID=312306 RepID=UPI004046FDFA